MVGDPGLNLHSTHAPSSWTERCAGCLSCGACRACQGSVVRALPDGVAAGHRLDGQHAEAVGPHGRTAAGGAGVCVCVWPLALLRVRTCALECAGTGKRVAPPLARSPPPATRHKSSSPLVQGHPAAQPLAQHPSARRAPAQGMPPCLATYSGHANERNFVGLSVSQDGYLACGSETNEVYCYYKVQGGGGGGCLGGCWGCRGALLGLGGCRGQHARGSWLWVKGQGCWQPWRCWPTRLPPSAQALPMPVLKHHKHHTLCAGPPDACAQAPHRGQAACRGQGRLGRQLQPPGLLRPGVLRLLRPLCVVRVLGAAQQRAAGRKLGRGDQVAEPGVGTCLLGHSRASPTLRAMPLIRAPMHHKLLGEAWFEEGGWVWALYRSWPSSKKNTST